VANQEKTLKSQKKQEKTKFSVKKDYQSTNIDDYRPIWMLDIENHLP
jgi:hypothetical protein